jgi:alkanesulfonate monooxygenase SsuD/methylene tetrahydromethanopterin reductase-like flavin-dependent oxidoreductase (luciferase family)
MRQLAEDAGKPIPQSGIVATVVPGETVESAWKMVNVKNVAAEMARMGYETPPTGEFRTIEDFDGALIAGPGEVIADEIQRYINLGATEIVFDLRLRLSDWAECVGMLADEVIPRLVRKM